MNNVRLGFEVYKVDNKDLVCYQENKCHFYLFIKLGEGFRRKTGHLGGAHVT